MPIGSQEQKKKVIARSDRSSDSDDAKPNEGIRTCEIVSFTIFPLCMYDTNFKVRIRKILFE